MSLATRCPACGTVFRVVHDQLRVSEGWVRCGRCSEVFNAVESLVELEAQDTQPTANHSTQRDRVIEDLARLAHQTDHTDHTDQTHAADPIEAPAPVPSPRPAIRPGPAPAALGGRARIDPDGSGLDLPAPMAAATAAAASPAPQEAADDSALLAEPAPQPAFVRQADRAARWRRPGVRLALALAALAAGATLLGQATVEYRDLISARWPALRPAVEQVCKLAGCDIRPPRALDALVVESSGLGRVEATLQYRLTVVLRNRAPFALAMPALELNLTDSQGALIARRVITVAELGSDQTSLAGASELALAATLTVADRPVSGYTIEIFYP